MKQEATDNPTELNRRAHAAAEVPGDLAREQRIRSLWATFRNILLVVFLIFVFAVVQMLVLQRVCNTGMKTAASLENQGLPTLNELASLQEQLVTFRLYSYEYLFAQEAEKTNKANAVETIAAQTRAKLQIIKTLFPKGEGQHLASDLEKAFADLNAEFQKVRNLAEADFPAAMKAMDEDIPKKIAQVATTAGHLKNYGYRFSGAKAQATFGSFGWIKTNTLMFGATNIVVAFGAVLFVLLAARRSRAQLSDTLARLDTRTQELAGSLSLVNATLESTADGIVLIDTAGKIGNYNQQFVRMWHLAEPDEVMKYEQRLLEFMLPLLKHAEKLTGKMEELTAHPDRESFDVLELRDDRVFEYCSKPQRIQDRICGRVWSVRDISDQKRMQREVEKTHQQLMLASRQAGMAEIASNVLHNVGNVLNSVNVSATLVADGLKKSKAVNLGKIVALLDEHAADLGAYLSSDPRGRQLPDYLRQMSEHVVQEQRGAVIELDSLRKNIEHIKDIVAMQQSYAKVSGLMEVLNVTDLIEDSLQMNEGAFTRHGVQIVREFQEVPPTSVEKHKVLQILVNLIRNAKYACDEGGRDDKQMTIRLRADAKHVRISVADNGVGIPPENLTRIFNHGFTTRKDGHGFGLHSGALAAKELGGSLSVQSDGPGQGATFTLELPCIGN